MPPQFPRMVAAELRKILSRASGWAGLVLSAVIPVAAVLALVWIKSRTAAEEVAANPMAQMMSTDVYTALDWALSARNFFVMPMILLMVTTQLFAGEWRARTLRSLVLQAVPRWSILGAKFSALALYSGVTLLVSLLVAFIPSLLLLDSELELQGVLLGYLAAWGTDAAVIAIGLAVSTFTTSVVLIVVGIVLGLLGEMVVRLGLKGAANFLGVEWAEPVLQWMPGTALDAWSGYQEAWNAQHFGALALLLAVSLGLTLFRFQRADIP